MACSTINDVSTNLSNKPISVEISNIVGIGLPKPRVVRVQSLNGEVHFVFPDSMSDEKPKNARNFDEIEIRRIMKKEVSKPLLLVRSE